MKNIVLTGMMGAGKSTISEKLAQKLAGFIAIDADKVIEYQENLSISKIFAQKGENYFRDLETQVIKKIFTKTNLIVALGGGAFECEENREFLLENGIVIYLEAEPQTLFERIKNSTNRPLLKEGFGEDRIVQILSAREKNYRLAHFSIKTDNKSTDEIVQEIVGLIGHVQ